MIKNWIFYTFSFEQMPFGNIIYIYVCKSITFVFYESVLAAHCTVVMSLP